MKDRGIFTISLDFELYWGVRDVRTIEQYRENLLGVRRAIPAMLELFREYEIHATWAVIGFLFFESKADLVASLPERRPEYTDASLCPYRYLDRVGNDEDDDPYHYAPSLIRMIGKYEHQEIGSHTLSHYYCLEDGQDREAFRQDMAAAINVARRRGLEVRSLVFPRNQVNPEYLPVCSELGIAGYRGNEESWLYESRNQTAESLLRRALRLTDAYLNLSGHNCYSLNGDQPANIRSSRFLRPASRPLAALEPLRLRRIKKDLDHAAQHGLIYHLWWHPHNFGRDTDRNIAFLRRVLDHFSKLRDKHGMLSMNMGEIAAKK